LLHTRQQQQKRGNTVVQIISRACRNRSTKQYVYGDEHFYGMVVLLLLPRPRLLGCWTNAESPWPFSSSDPAALSSPALSICGGHHHGMACAAPALCSPRITWLCAAVPAIIRPPLGPVNGGHRYHCALACPFGLNPLANSPPSAYEIWAGCVRDRHVANAHAPSCSVHEDAMGK
jgi:hypothetical protein